MKSRQAKKAPFLLQQGAVISAMRPAAEGYKNKQMLNISTNYLAEKDAIRTCEIFDVYATHLQMEVGIL